MTGFGKNNVGMIGSLFGVFQTVAKPFLLTPEKGARTSIYLAASPDVEGVTGRYFANSREKQSNPISHDREVARRLWDVSEGGGIRGSRRTRNVRAGMTERSWQQPHRFGSPAATTINRALGAAR